ncbi:MAG: sugar ABC transporter permease [Spirochaetia bacterium]|jgi:raffinose/stachyose/melibiose transport system permease protein
MERMLRNKWTIFVFMFPLVLVFTLVVPVPLISSLFISLFDWNLIGASQYVGLRNFVSLFTTDFIFPQALGNTFVYLLLSILFQLPMAFFLANLLYGARGGKDVFRVVIFLPVACSSVAISLMWYFLYHPEMGLVNQAIRLLGFRSFKWAWLAEQKTAMLAVTVSVAWQWTGYHMVIYLAGMANIPGELVESARLDGANSLQVVRHIVFPFLLPMIAVSTILITTSSLKSFDSIYILTFGGPNHATEVLASHMYIKAFAQMKYGYGSSIGVILFCLCIVSTVVIQRAAALFGYEEVGA